MSRAAALGLPAVLLAAVAMAVPSGSGAAEPVFRPFSAPAPVDGFAAVGPAVVRHWVATLSRDYALPAGARQGAGGWYGLRLRARVRVRRLAAPSLVYVSGLTNGRASVQLKIRVPARSQPRRPVRWEMYGLLDGLVRHVAPDDDVVLDARNFLQYRGVVPGRNTLSVEVEQYAGRSLVSAEVLPETAVLHGFPRPARVRLAVDRGKVIMRGSSVLVPVTVRNTGGWAVREVRFGAQSLDGSLRYLDARPAKVGVLAPGRAVSVTLRLEALRAGPAALRVTAVSNVTTSSDGVRIQVPEAALRRRRVSWWRKMAPNVVFVPSALVLIVPPFVRRRRRRLAR